MQLNKELLSICLDEKCIRGALKGAYKNKSTVCSHKHAGGKNIKRRSGRDERQYDRSIFLQKLMKDIKMNYYYLTNNNFINQQEKTLEENLKNIGYTLEDAKREFDKFCKVCNVYKVYEVNENGYFNFRLFEF